MVRQTERYWKNPYDGRFLSWSLAHNKLKSGVAVKTAVLQEGYLGHKTG